MGSLALILHMPFAAFKGRLPAGRFALFVCHHVLLFVFTREADLRGAAIGVFAWRIKNKVILLWQLVSVSFQLFNQRRAGFTVFRELASRQEQATRAIP